MAEADDGKDLAVGLEVLPGAGRGTADYELEAQAAGVPRLVGEWTLLVLGIEGADRREVDPAVAHQHGDVIPELRLRYRAADGDNCHADHALRLHARVRLH